MPVTATRTIVAAAPVAALVWLGARASTKVSSVASAPRPAAAPPTIPSTLHRVIPTIISAIFAHVSAVYQPHRAGRIPPLRRSLLLGTLVNADVPGHPGAPIPHYRFVPTQQGSTDWTGLAGAVAGAITVSLAGLQSVRSNYGRRYRIRRDLEILRALPAESTERARLAESIDRAVGDLLDREARTSRRSRRGLALGGRLHRCVRRHPGVRGSNSALVALYLGGICRPRRPGDLPYAPTFQAVAV